MNGLTLVEAVQPKRAGEPCTGFSALDLAAMANRLFVKFNQPALHHIAPSHGRSMLAVLRQHAVASGLRFELVQSFGTSGDALREIVAEE